MRRVHHASVADVDAYVTESGKEEQVARLHPGACHAPTQVIERVGAVREFHAESSVCPVDEPGAVEPAGRRYATPSIRHADLLECNRRRALAEGPDRNRAHRTVARWLGRRRGSTLQPAR